MALSLNELPMGCEIHQPARRLVNSKSQTLVCADCMGVRLSADSSRYIQQEPRTLKVDQGSTYDVLNASVNWPNGRPREAGFCKRRTCLYVSMNFDRDCGVYVCPECDYFEIPGDIAAKDVRVIYSEDVKNENKRVHDRCPRCASIPVLDEERELYVCWGCDYFEVAIFLQLETALDRVKNGLQRATKQVSESGAQRAAAL
jgi:ribosomal protein S27AE